MEELLHSLDRSKVLSVVGTVGLLVLGTVIFFRSNEMAKKAIKPAKEVKSNSKAASSTSTGTSSSSITSRSTSMPSANIVPNSITTTSTTTTTTNTAMKGYKMTSDGRKTTYFNREITEEEKILLGDFTPKPLTSAISADSLSPSAKSGSSTGSAWNTAGTWEEKNHSPWAAKRLRTLLTLASLDIAGGSVKVTKVNSIEGDALITMIRGKKKFIYDYTVSLDWKVQTGVTTISGTVTISDVNAECDYEFDTSTTSSPIATAAYRDTVQKYVKSKTDGMQLLIRQKLDRFLLDFKLLDN